MAQYYRRLVDISSGEPVLDSGMLRHSITIEHDVVSSPPVINEGGVVETPEDFTTAMAGFETYNTGDHVREGQTTSELQAVVVLWYQPGILGGMRVVMPNGSKYVIQEVDNVLQMDIALVLTCLGLSNNA